MIESEQLEKIWCKEYLTQQSIEKQKYLYELIKVALSTESEKLKERILEICQDDDEFELL